MDSAALSPSQNPSRGVLLRPDQKNVGAKTGLAAVGSVDVVERVVSAW